MHHMGVRHDVVIGIKNKTRTLPRWQNFVILSHVYGDVYHGRIHLGIKRLQGFFFAGDDRRKGRLDNLNDRGRRAHGSLYLSHLSGSVRYERNLTGKGYHQHQ
jgi:hypothetical protein